MLEKKNEKRKLKDDQILNTQDIQTNNNLNTKDYVRRIQNFQRNIDLRNIKYDKFSKLLSSFDARAGRHRADISCMLSLAPKNVKTITKEKYFEIAKNNLSQNQSNASTDNINF